MGTCTLQPSQFDEIIAAMSNYDEANIPRVLRRVERSNKSGNIKGMLAFHTHKAALEIRRLKESADLKTIIKHNPNYEKDLIDFYQNNIILKNILSKQVNHILKFLEESNFIKVSNNELIATKLGKIVNLTYLDPYTANTYIDGLRKKSETKYCSTLF